MNDEQKKLHLEHGGSISKRIEELGKYIAAYDDVNAVRSKYGLPTADDYSTEINVRMRTLEELVFGDYITSIKKRLQAVSSHADANTNQ